MDGIFEVEGILSENDCERIIEVFHENIEYASPGEFGYNKVDKSIKDTLDMFLPIKNDPATHSALMILQNACDRVLDKYIEYFRDHGLDRGNYCEHSIIEFLKKSGVLSNPQIQKVSTGGKFDWHTDLAPRHIIQFIFYLNDNYEGGKTEFSNGRIIQPKKGKVLIIPCTIQAVHRGNVVTDGIKYISSVYLLEKPSNF
jgi:hypothetical protein